MQLISLSGKKQSGKTTTALLIKDILTHYDSDLDVFIISWADTLKEEVCKGTGISLAYLEEHKILFRPILQWWGTEFRRNLFSQDYWVKQLLYKLTQLPNDCIVIVPDTRFLNEVDAMKHVGGLLWKLERKTSDNDTHQSENDLKDFKDWNAIINNNCLIGELKGNIIVELAKARLIKG